MDARRTLAGRTHGSQTSGLRQWAQDVCGSRLLRVPSLPESGRHDWSGSDNVAEATLLYPAPVRFQLFGLQTFGYAKRVVFPVRVKLQQPDRDAHLKLKLNVLVCSDVCVPQVLNLALNVAKGPGTPSADAHLIQRAVAAVPGDGKTTGLGVLSTLAVVVGDETGLAVDISSNAPLAKLDVIPEARPFIAFSAPDISWSPDQKRARALFKLAQPLPAGESLVGRELLLTLTNGALASEIKATIGDGGGTAASSALATFAMMVGAALLGGLILNLMPCVLPVLSVKLLSLVKAQQKAASTVRTSFLATAAGIITALLALAVGLIALKSAGLAVGWGIQFQQPIFITTLAVIITLFACNLWGFFEITLPASLSNWAGGQDTPNASLAGHFLTGIFVTILATPCSAPFLGTAVGFALASGTIETVAIFTALGVGLALPYIAVALLPALVRFLPRPGPWMETLRRILGFALLATTGWLLSVLARQVGWSLTGLAGVLLAALIGMLALRHTHPARLSRQLALGLTVLFSAATIALPVLLRSDQARVAVEETGRVAWQTFDEKQIRGLIAQGKTVFVDVTADWCITCKANKRLVLNQDPVADRLGRGVVAMQADWTSPDPKITRFLARFGRYGIPMNVVFGPGSPQGTVLPEILTSERVLDALSAAGAS